MVTLVILRHVLFRGTTVHILQELGSPLYATKNVKGPVQSPSFYKHIDWNDGSEVQVRVQVKTQIMNLSLCRHFFSIYFNYIF